MLDIPSISVNEELVMLRLLGVFINDDVTASVNAKDRTIFDVVDSRKERVISQFMSGNQHCLCVVCTDSPYAISC